MQRRSRGVQRRGPAEYRNSLYRIVSAVRRSLVYINAIRTNAAAHTCIHACMHTVYVHRTRKIVNGADKKKSKSAYPLARSRIQTFRLSQIEQYFIQGTCETNPIENYPIQLFDLLPIAEERVLETFQKVKEDTKYYNLIKNFFSDIRVCGQICADSICWIVLSISLLTKSSKGSPMQLSSGGNDRFAIRT